MKKLILLMLLVFTVNVNAFEAENEVVTDAQFQADLKKSKSKKSKFATIPSSGEMVANPKSHMGKQYRMMMFTEGMVGFGCVKKPKPMCDFSYVNMDDGGFGAQVGDGVYSLECFDKKSCLTLEDRAGEATSVEAVLVEMVDVVKLKSKQGQTTTAPLLKIIKLVD